MLIYYFAVEFFYVVSQPADVPFNLRHSYRSGNAGERSCQQASFTLRAVKPYPLKVLLLLLVKAKMPPSVHSAKAFSWYVLALKSVFYRAALYVMQ